MANKKYSGYLAILVIAITFLILFYSKAFFHPNQYLFGGNGDAIKNYYTYAYHIKNDSSYTNFEGMNYPYGEHYLFTDCHPLLANTLKTLSKVCPSILNYSIGILNFLLLFSILVTFIITYALLKYLKVKNIHTILGTTAIVIMAPQIFRLNGHFALSYSFFIPLSMYLLLRLKNAEKNPVIWILYLCTTNLIALFTHAYLGVMIVFFQLSFWFMAYVLSKSSIWSKLRSFIPYFIFAIIPTLFFNIYLNLTDIHSGRTDNPSGFMLHNTEVDDLLVPHHPPLLPFLSKTLGIKVDLNWEAWSYIGFATTISLLILGIRWIRQKNKKQIADKKHKKYSNDTKLLLLASLPLLIFAFGIPFKQFPSLLDWLPSIKHFRATGRFGWLFYYGIIIFVISNLSYISQRITDNGKKFLGFIIVPLYCVIMIVEGVPYHTTLSKQIALSKNIFTTENLNQDYSELIKKIDKDKFQAIFPLPFYHYGSESYARPRKQEICNHTILLSYHLNLPIIGANLTRVSIPESKKIVQLVSPRFYSKEIASDFDSQKPLLLIKSNEALSKYETDILKISKPITHNELFSAFELLPEQMFGDVSQKEFDKFRAVRKNLFPNQSFYVKDPSGFLYYNNFEKNKSSISFRGSGAHTGLKKGENIYAEFPSNTFEKGKNYHLSMWMHNGFKDALNLWFRFIIEETNNKGERVNRTTIFPEESEVINGNWSLVECNFKIKDAQNSIKIYSIGKSNSKAKLVADDLLIRGANNDIYKIDSIQNNYILFKNNHHITMKK